MGNLKKRGQALLALVLNIIPAFQWVRRAIRPYWKYIIPATILSIAIRNLTPRIQLPAQWPEMPHVPVSFLVFLAIGAFFLLSCCAFGYVLFTFLALVIKINQVLAQDVRGVATFVSNIKEKATAASEGNFYAYDEELQAGIEEQQKAKREKRLADEEFEKFVKASAGDLNVDMNASGLP